MAIQEIELKNSKDQVAKLQKEKKRAAQNLEESR